MLAAVLAGPSVILEGDQPGEVLPAISVPGVAGAGHPSVAQGDARAARWLGHALHAMQPVRLAELFESFLTLAAAGTGAGLMNGEVHAQNL
jgi:hypothetical protein